MAARPAMNQNQRRFFRLYLGRDERLAGNGTRCYQAVYGPVADRTAQVGASRLVRKPEFKAWLDEIEREALAELAIDAKYVKTQAVRLLDRAMGDEPVETVTVETDPETGEERISVHERREYDPATAHKALQLIGAHKDVQAFAQVVEHQHTHRLEQRLAAKSKQVEAAAIEGQYTQLPDDQSQLPSPAGQGHQKRVHPAGPQAEIDAEQIESSAERAGATADLYHTQSTQPESHNDRPPE